jgi:hypothetical protein
MNKFLSTIAATFAMVTLTTTVFAADATKPVIPAPPVVASQPAAVIAEKPVVPAPPVVAAQEPATDTPAKIKTDNLLERKKKAKAASGIGNNTDGSGSTMNAEKLNEINRKARENTKTLNSNLPKETTTAVPPAAK